MSAVTPHNSRSSSSMVRRAVLVALAVFAVLVPSASAQDAPTTAPATTGAPTPGATTTQPTPMATAGLTYDFDSSYELIVRGLTVDQRLLVDVTVPIGHRHDSHAYFALCDKDDAELNGDGFSTLAASSNGETTSCASVPMSYHWLDLNTPATYIVTATSESEMRELYPNGTEIIFDTAGDGAAATPVAWNHINHTASDNDTPMKQHTRPTLIGSASGTFVLAGTTPPRALHYERLSLYDSATVSSDGTTATYHLSVHLPSAQFYCSTSGGVSATHSVDPVTGSPTSIYRVTLQHVNASTDSLGSVRLEATIRAHLVGLGADDANSTSGVVTFAYLSAGHTLPAVALYRRPRVVLRETPPGPPPGTQRAALAFAVAVTYRHDGPGVVVGPRLGRLRHTDNGTAVQSWLPWGRQSEPGDLSPDELKPSTTRVVRVWRENGRCHVTSLVGITPDLRPVDFTGETGLDFRTRARDEWQERGAEAGQPECGLTTADWQAASTNGSATAAMDAALPTNATSAQKALAANYCDCALRAAEASNFTTDPVPVHAVCRDPRRALCVDEQLGGGSVQSVCRYVLELQTEQYELAANGSTFVSACPGLADTGATGAEPTAYGLLLEAERCSTSLRAADPALLASAFEPGVCEASDPLEDTIAIHLSKAVFPDPADAQTERLVAGAYLLRNDQLAPGLWPAPAGHCGVPTGALPASGLAPVHRANASFGQECTSAQGGLEPLRAMEALLRKSIAAQSGGGNATCPFEHAGDGESGGPRGTVDTDACTVFPPGTPNFTSADTGQPDPGDPSDLCVVFVVLSRAALWAQDSFLYVDPDSLVLTPVRGQGAPSALGALPALSKANLDAADHNTTGQAAGTEWDWFLGNLTVMPRELYRNKRWNGTTLRNPRLPVANNQTDNRTLPWVQSGDALDTTTVPRPQLSATDGLCLNLHSLLALYQRLFHKHLNQPLQHQATAFHVQAKVHYVPNDATLGRRRLLQEDNEYDDDTPDDEDTSQSESGSDEGDTTSAAPTSPPTEGDGGPSPWTLPPAAPWTPTGPQEAECRLPVSHAHSGHGGRRHHHHDGANLTTTSAPTGQQQQHACVFHLATMVPFHVLGLAPHARPWPRGASALLTPAGLAAVSRAESSAVAQVQSNIQASVTAGSIVVSPVFHLAPPPAPGLPPRHHHALHFHADEAHSLVFPDGSMVQYDPYEPPTRRISVRSPEVYLGSHTLTWSTHRTLVLLLVGLLLAFLGVALCCGLVGTAHAVCLPCLRACDADHKTAVRGRSGGGGSCCCGGGADDDDDDDCATNSGTAGAGFQYQHGRHTFGLFSGSGAAYRRVPGGASAVHMTSTSTFNP